MLIFAVRKMEQENNHKKSTDTLLVRWSKALQKRWGVSGNKVLIILFIFACTGTTVMLLKQPIIKFFSTAAETPIVFTVIYYLLILPIYNILLLVFGLIFGQFKFFWEFEKKMIGRIFKRNKK